MQQFISQILAIYAPEGVPCPALLAEERYLLRRDRLNLEAWKAGFRSRAGVGEVMLWAESPQLAVPQLRFPAISRLAPPVSELRNRDWVNAVVALLAPHIPPGVVFHSEFFAVHSHAYAGAASAEYAGLTLYRLALDRVYLGHGPYLGHCPTDTSPGQPVGNTGFVFADLGDQPDDLPNLDAPQEAIGGAIGHIAGLDRIQFD